MAGRLRTDPSARGQTEQEAGGPISFVNGGDRKQEVVTSLQTTQSGRTSGFLIKRRSSEAPQVFFSAAVVWIWQSPEASWEGLARPHQ